MLPEGVSSIAIRADFLATPEKRKKSGIAQMVGCHYFPPGPQLPPTLKRAATNFAGCTMGVNSLPKTVTRQRRDCDLNPRGGSKDMCKYLHNTI